MKRSLAAILILALAACSPKAGDAAASTKGVL